MPLLASNYRNEQGLQQYLEQRGIVAIADIDTRRLTRILQGQGCPERLPYGGGLISMRQRPWPGAGFAGLKGMDLAKEVSVTETYSWDEGSWVLA